MSSFNDMMGKVGKGAGKILEELKESNNSGFLGDVFPSAERMSEEIANRINSNEAAKISHMSGALDQRVNEALEGLYTNRMKGDSGISYGESEFKKAVDSILDKEKKYNDGLLNNLEELLKKNKVSDKDIEKARGMIKREFNKAMENAKVAPESVKPGLAYFASGGVKEYIGAYFHNPDPKVARRRITAVAGTYAGATVLPRLLSGGSLTEDQYGQNNIVGIPFV